MSAETPAEVSLWGWRFRCPGCAVVGELIPPQCPAGTEQAALECRECGWKGHARDGEAWPEGEGPPLGKPRPWWSRLWAQFFEGNDGRPYDTN